MLMAFNPMYSALILNFLFKDFRIKIMLQLFPFSLSFIDVSFFVQTSDSIPEGFDELFILNIVNIFLSLHQNM